MINYFTQVIVVSININICKTDENNELFITRLNSFEYQFTVLIYELLS